MQLRGVMGQVRRDRPRDLSKYETIYEDPDYRRLRAFMTHAPDRSRASALVGGSSLETLGGLTAVVLALIGLSYQPIVMCAIATIAIGIGLAAEGISIMARWRDNLRRLDGPQFDRSELASGVSTEVFGGCVGIVLGVLALTGLMPYVLLPVAVVVFGGSLLLGGPAQRELVHLAPEHDPRFARVTYSAIQGSGGIMVLVGVGAAVLGILALLNVGPIVRLTLVAMLSIGASLLLGGGALTARFVHALRGS